MKCNDAIFCASKFFMLQCFLVFHCWPLYGVLWLFPRVVARFWHKTLLHYELFISAFKIETVIVYCRVTFVFENALGTSQTWMSRKKRKRPSRCQIFCSRQSGGKNTWVSNWPKRSPELKTWDIHMSKSLWSGVNLELESLVTNHCSGIRHIYDAR